MERNLAPHATLPPADPKRIRLSRHRHGTALSYDDASAAAASTASVRTRGSSLGAAERLRRSAPRERIHRGRKAGQGRQSRTGLVGQATFKMLYPDQILGRQLPRRGITRTSWMKPQSSRARRRRAPSPPSDLALPPASPSRRRWLPTFLSERGTSTPLGQRFQPSSSLMSDRIVSHAIRSGADASCERTQRPVSGRRTINIDGASRRPQLPAFLVDFDPRQRPTFAPLPATRPDPRRTVRRKGAGTVKAIQDHGAPVPSRKAPSTIARSAPYQGSEIGRRPQLTPPPQERLNVSPDMEQIPAPTRDKAAPPQICVYGKDGN